jgi:hypothetical protein
MGSGHSDFKVTAGYKNDLQKTKIVLDVKQWGTPNFSMPNLHMYAAGTGWDISIFVEELSQLEALRDALITACQEHQAATQFTEGVTS